MKRGYMLEGYKKRFPEIGIAGKYFEYPTFYFIFSLSCLLRENACIFLFDLLPQLYN